ncbi:MAG TPA: sulfatase, partial [Lacipirellulaceae bacterium]|nr:sulfatase [Lacipirellulaceae bacterium]
MLDFDQFRQYVTRRHFLSTGSHLLGTAALATLTGKALAGSTSGKASGHFIRTNFAPKAKQIIYLHMVGGPPQMDMFDYKPVMGDWYDKDLPDSVRQGQRLTGMTSGQARFPIAPSMYKFERCG